MNKTREDVLDALMGLPQEWYSDFLWLIENYSLAVEICKAEVLTEERETLKQAAIAKNDRLLFLLAELERIVNRKRA